MTDRTTGKARLLRFAGVVALMAVVGQGGLCVAADDGARGARSMSAGTSCHWPRMGRRSPRSAADSPS